jgi:hypothetical protein
VGERERERERRVCGYAVVRVFLRVVAGVAGVLMMVAGAGARMIGLILRMLPLITVRFSVPV